MNDRKAPGPMLAVSTLLVTPLVEIESLVPSTPPDLVVVAYHTVHALRFRAASAGNESERIACDARLTAMEEAARKTPLGATLLGMKIELRKMDGSARSRLAGGN